MCKKIKGSKGWFKWYGLYVIFYDYLYGNVYRGGLYKRTKKKPKYFLESFIKLLNKNHFFF